MDMKELKGIELEILLEEKHHDLQLLQRYNDKLAKDIANITDEINAIKKELLSREVTCEDEECCMPPNIIAGYKE